MSSEGLNLSIIETRKLFQRLDSIAQQCELQKFIIKEKSQRPHYSDLQSLMQSVRTAKLECTHSYECVECPTKKRNLCLSTANKKFRKQQLLNMLPTITRNQLGNLKITELWMIVNHLKIKTTQKNRAWQVKCIWDYLVRTRSMQNAEATKETIAKAKELNLCSKH